MIRQESVRKTSTTHPNRRRLPRAVAAVAHGVLAFAVLFGIVQSGSRYFYCEALGLMPSDPCAQVHTVGAARSECPSGALSEHHADCCEVVTLGTMPRAAQAASPSIAPADLVATIPALQLAERIDVAPSRVARAFERWRPPPRASNEIRARLMVFVI